MFPRTNEQKLLVWNAHQQRRPLRVPVRLNTNPRIIVLDPQLNSEGFTFEQVAKDPQTHVKLALFYQRYLRTVLNQYCDAPVGLPDTWEIGMHIHNVGEAASLGAPIAYPPGQIPSTEPFLTDDDKHRIFEQETRSPLEVPFVRHCLAFWREMERICRDLRFENRPVRLLPWGLMFSQGPVTVACSLRGTGFLLDLIDDPDYANRLLEFIMEAAIRRRQAFWDYWGQCIERCNIMADDSVATLGPDMLRERLVPLYRRYYAAGETSGAPPTPRMIHLCGDATRHFAILHEQVGVNSFDTGFPVDHGAVRKQLGPDVEIAGGPEVALLMAGTPTQVYERTRQILFSGIKEGGRFILQEGNNLPPCCPSANLEAMYTAALEFGEIQPK